MTNVTDRRRERGSRASRASRARLILARDFAGLQDCVHRNFDANGDSFRRQSPRNLENTEKTELYYKL